YLWRRLAARRSIPSVTISQPQPRAAASAAFARHAWREAFDRYAEADRESSLAPTDLMSFAEAAWWCGQPDDGIRLLERAYASYVDTGERRAAAGAALRLCDNY